MPDKLRIQLDVAKHSLEHIEYLLDHVLKNTPTDWPKIGLRDYVQVAREMVRKARNDVPPITPNEVLV
jgi:acyl carrier protein phosphodiesterase